MSPPICSCWGACEAYDFSRLRSEADVAFSAVLGVCAATVICFLLSTVAILYYAPGTQVIGRAVFLWASVANLVFLAGWRVWYTRQRRRRGELNTRVIVAGAAQYVDAVKEDLERYSRGGHEIAGYVVDDEDAPPEDPHFLGPVSELPALVKQHGAEEILVIGEGLPQRPERLLRVIEACEAAEIPVHVLPGLYEAVVGRLDLYEIGGLPLIGLKRRPLTRAYAVVKRILDVTGAVAGLLLSLPVFAVAGLLIKLDSPGQVFFRQRRCGLHGREFEILKLRTMYKDAEKETGPVWAGKDDPRVTRVGRFLRRRRIDELPQFWNVLKGEMALIGPRPERPEFVEEFTRLTPLFPLRMRMRPGLTSLSHVLGRYDSHPLHRLLYDLAYLNNCSFLLDLRILVATVKIVLSGRGAQ